MLDTSSDVGNDDKYSGRQMESAMASAIGARQNPSIRISTVAEWIRVDTPT